MNTNLLLEELLKNSKKFIVDVRVWDDYPKDPAYFALAAFLEKVIIPTIEIVKKDHVEEIEGLLSTAQEGVAWTKQNEDASWRAENKRRRSNTKVTKLRGETV